MQRKYEPFREINEIKCFLKEVNLVKNITFNSIKLMKIFKETMQSLKYIEKKQKDQKQIENQSFYKNPWILLTNINRNNEFTLTIITRTNMFTGGKNYLDGRVYLGKR